MNRISKHSMEAMPEATPTILLFRRTPRPISASPRLFRNRLIFDGVLKISFKTWTLRKGIDRKKLLRYAAKYPKSVRQAPQEVLV